MPSGRSRGSRRSRRSEGEGASVGDGEQLLDLLGSLQPSARSQSGRHTLRSGLIPPCLESPHRIQSSFPVPSATLAQVPGLNHPDLSRGQRRYLHSTAQIYSLDGTKRALSDSYYGLLMSELLRGGGTRDSHKRYTGWIYGNHKRLFETNPAIWRSRKLPSSSSSREAATTSGEQRTAANNSNNNNNSNAPQKDERSARSADRNSSSSGRDSNSHGLRRQPSQQGDACTDESSKATSSQNRRRSARGRDERASAADKQQLDDDDDDDVDVAPPPRVRSATRPKSRPSARGRRVDEAAERSDVVRGHDRQGKGENDQGDDDDDAMDNGPRPRDLSRIMF